MQSKNVEETAMERNNRNPQECDCEQCGNPIYKSRARDEVKCCWCGYINRVGKYVGGRKHKKNDGVKQ